LLFTDILKTLQNAVEYLHYKFKSKRWQKNSNVSFFCAMSRGCVFKSVHSWFGPLHLCTDYIVLHTKTTRSSRATRKGRCLLLLHWCIETSGNFSVSGQENNLGPGAITVIDSLCPFRVDPCLSVGPLFGLGVVCFDPTKLWTRQTRYLTARRWHLE